MSTLATPSMSDVNEKTASGPLPEHSIVEVILEVGGRTDVERCAASFRFRRRGSPHRGTNRRATAWTRSMFARVLAAAAAVAVDKSVVDVAGVG